MKNIHVLKTDKPSRLFYYNGHLGLARHIVKKNDGVNTQHIYITSSDEEIKDNEWLLKNGKPVRKSGHIKHYAISEPKVILTTDPDLIADGVQAIDDTFLEWFVKNPNCEEVDVVDDLKYFNIDELRERHIKRLPHLYSEKIGYKIIIPNEEQKQNLIDMIQDDEKLGLYDESKQEKLGYICPQTKKQCDDECCVSAEDCHIESSFSILEESKKETLEEASWRFNPLKKLDGEFLRDAFVKGAESDAARDYWFSIFKEQFKK